MLENQKPRVLYIDDEENNLISFRAGFRREYEVHTAKSAKEATEKLGEHPFHVIIADQRMPEMSGVQFFESILERHPNPMRILLTGFSDIEAVIDAINKGEVHRYLSKPWNEFELKVTIDNAVNIYKLREQNRLLTEKYRTVFEKTGDALFIADIENRIVEFNEATTSLFEYSKQELLKKPFSELFLNDDEAEKLVKKLDNKLIVKDFEVKLVKKNGNEIDCLISANEFKDNDDNITGFQGIIKDITEKNLTKNLLMKTAIDTQEKERERFARDLHDGLSQQLSGVKFYMETLKNTDPDKEDFNILLEKCSETLNDVFPQIRNICFNLMPRVLENFGIKMALEELTGKTLLDNSLSFHMKIDEELPELNKSLEIAIFRITQEFINNSIKYGQSNTISIELYEARKRLVFKLQDDGVGFDTKKEKTRKHKDGSGMGIKNVTSRVESFNGTFKLISKPREGTQYDIKIPLTGEALVTPRDMSISEEL